MFNFKVFKDALTKYSSTLKGVRDEIDETELEIENILFAPLAKEDVKTAFRTWISAEAAQWRELLVTRLASVQSRADVLGDPNKLRESMNLSGLLMLGAHSGAIYQGQLDAKFLQRSLIGMFEEPMWKAIESALEGLKWDPNAISIKDRAEKLEALNKKLADLKSQEAQLVKDAEDVGIDPSGVE